MVEGVGLLALLALGAWLFSRQANSPAAHDYSPPGDEPATNPADDWAVGWSDLPPEPAVPIAATVTDTAPAQSIDSHRAAFLAMIRQFESAGRYDVMYGGRTFDSYTDHPRQYFPINLPGYAGLKSSATGAYQFIARTWDTLRDRLGLPDFSPASQDAAALELLREIGALPHIDTGDFDAALRKASGQWASLPYSTSGQPKHSVADALAVIRQNSWA